VKSGPDNRAGQSVFQHPPTSVPELKSEVLAIRMNEVVASQLHANTISLQDAQALRIKGLEEQLDGMGMILHHVREDQRIMRERLDEAHRLSVMCQSVLTHYVESHWIPMSLAFGQIGRKAPCHFFGSVEHCDISDVTAFSLGMSGPSTPASLPSLESVTSSSVDSVYYTPTFLSTMQTTSPPSLQEGFLFINEGGPPSPSTLLATVPGDLGSSGSPDQGELLEIITGGIPLSGDEGWCPGCSGSHALDPVGEGH